MGMDDIEGGSQANSGSSRLSRVKGLKNMVQRRLVHPDPVIDHLQTDIVAWGRRIQHWPAAFGHHDIGGADRNMTSPCGNGVGGIEQQIHNNLLQLRIIAKHRMEVAGQLEGHLRFGGEPGVEQVNCLQDHLIHVEEGRFDPPALHIGKQVIRELCHTASGAHGSIQMAPRRTIHRQLVESNGGVSQDNRQQIVKIMDNPADLDTAWLYLLFDNSLFYEQREGRCIINRYSKLLSPRCMVERLHVTITYRNETTLGRSPYA
jgi:hypothetical protein